MNKNYQKMKKKQIFTEMFINNSYNNKKTKKIKLFLLIIS